MGDEHLINKENQADTGSSSMGEPVYLTIGILGKPHGIKGEILLFVRTDFPERIRKGKYVFIGDLYDAYILESVRQHSRGLLIKFETLDSIESVEMLRGKDVFVKVSSLPPLPEGEYYHHQLLGMDVFTTEGTLLGKLTEILETGSNDVYVVKTSEGKEELIPALKQNLIKIDVSRKTMVVEVPKYYNQD